MDLLGLRLTAILAASSAAALTVFLVQRRWPELRGVLWGLHVTVMTFVFSFFFRDMEPWFVSGLHTLATVSLLIQVTRRLGRRVRA